jgi:SAM-dependent methyltransferase
VIDHLRSLYNGALFHVGQRVRSRHVLAAVERLVPASGRVLDAGAGGGGFSLAVARRHPALEVEGIELDPRKVAAGEAAARRLGLANLRFAAGDITRLGRPERYDLAFSVDVLEHVEDDAAAFRSLAESLRPGGVLVLHVPRDHPRRFFRALDDHHQDDHVRDGYAPAALAAALRAAGFEDVSIRHTFGTAGELAWEVMQLVRRGRPSRPRELAGVALSPLLALLCELDFRLGGGARGNGLLVEARRPRAAAGGRQAGGGAVSAAAAASA